MKCTRLQALLREWYQEVRSFNLSPLKMMELVERHIKHCEICKNDEDLPLELDQLRELIRVPQVPVHVKTKLEEPQYAYEEEEVVEEEEEEF
ncbi:MAG: hypothetical protein LM575_06285 [Caldimicrobium sp.]|nr:hypothetical protein [Caldimicrobium sp.]MCC6048885.1 hypothetical protein [Thermodesulfobacterium sp.]